MRGTPQQIIDKYLSLARDAQTSGDRVTAENFLQHAEHYQRILIQATQAQEQARRDQQEAATDGREDQQPQGGAEREAESAAATPPTEAPQPAIGGMDMIDSEAAEQPLIVDGDAKTEAPRKRNGEGRRRKRTEPEAAQEAPPASAEAQPEG